jgi:hypothetical protein
MQKGLIQIHTPFLFCLLVENEVLGVDIEANKPLKVDGHKTFLPHYVHGFFEGKEQFEKDYPFDSKIIYGENSKLIVSSFHQLLYHSQLKPQTGSRRGWAFVQNNDPLLITETELHFFGYYSGMLAGFYELFNKYPKALEGFEKCESNLPHTASAKIKLKVIDQKSFGKVLTYFDSWGIDSQAITDAISGNSHNERIYWPYNQNQLADLLRRLKKHNVIIEADTRIASWLSSFFEFENSGIVKPFTYDSCHDILRGKSRVKNDSLLMGIEFPDKN